VSRILITIFVIITSVCACSKEGSAINATWQIVESQSNGFMLKKGTVITFLNGTIAFSGEDSYHVFPVLVSEKRLVIKTEKENFLFTIDRKSDSVWILTELYKDNPVIIKINKVKI